MTAEKENNRLSNNLTFDDLTNFTLKSYEKILRYLQQIYKIVPFCQIPKKDVPFIILRHDVDYSPSAALTMAQIEKDLGIKSTYFVLFSSPFYSILEAKTAAIFRQISNFGHEIGLHYHPSTFRSYQRNLKKTLNAQIHLLEHLLNRKVYSISRHGPWDKDPFATTKEYINANHPYFARDISIADGWRAWFPLQDFLNLFSNPPYIIQLQIHPCMWQPDEIGRKALLKRLIQNSEERFNRWSDLIQEIWSTEPVIRDYDLWHKRNDSREQLKIIEPSKMQLQKTNTYSTLTFHHHVRWYLRNSSLGWKVNEKVLKKLRKLKKSKEKGV